MSVTEKILNIRNICLSRGQEGLLELTKKFDNAELTSLAFKIPGKVSINQEIQDAIAIARDNIGKFHRAEYNKLLQFEQDKIETSKGIKCWRKFTPIETIGIYIPNKLFSSALMNIIPAQIARCKNIVVCTPPNPSEEILYTISLLGINTIYTIGGAQAIFAMTYGIGEIPKVDKIFGPGNQFIDGAKKLVSSEVAIDMPAGPSEVLVIADKDANQEAVMFDLLAQLEHGIESKAWLLSTDENIVSYIKANIAQVINSSPRRSILKHSLDNLDLKVVESVDEAIAESNKIAPEHLILNIADANNYLAKITNAGSVFVGRQTPESLGDYLSGTNHVLPTSGFAKSFSGLSVLSFGKFITFQEATKQGLDSVSKSISIMAQAECLDFHARSVENRTID